MIRTTAPTICDLTEMFDEVYQAIGSDESFGNVPLSHAQAHALHDAMKLILSTLDKRGE